MRASCQHLSQTPFSGLKLFLQTMCSLVAWDWSWGRAGGTSTPQKLVNAMKQGCFVLFCFPKRQLLKFINMPLVHTFSTAWWELEFSVVPNWSIPSVTYLLKYIFIRKLKTLGSNMPIIPGLKEPGSPAYLLAIPFRAQGCDDCH